MKEFYYRIDSKGEIYIYSRNNNAKKDYLDWIEYCNSLKFKYENKFKIFLAANGYDRVFYERNKDFETKIYENEDYRITYFKNLNKKLKYNVFLKFKKK